MAPESRCSLFHDGVALPSAHKALGLLQGGQTLIGEAIRALLASRRPVPRPA